jgi:hypothetical protein
MLGKLQYYESRHKFTVRFEAAEPCGPMLLGVDHFGGLLEVVGEGLHKALRFLVGLRRTRRHQSLLHLVDCK